MTSNDLDSLATQAWLFGYPLMLMDVTRQVSAARGAPVNTFNHRRSLPDPTITEVTSPNADTLLSTAWLDLRAEPIVLTVPPTGDRYLMMPMFSGWTDVFASPGSRTTGDEGAQLAICPVGWKGALPDGVQRLDSPTALVWVTARVSAAGTRDYLAAHSVQDQLRLEPLSRLDPEHLAPRGVAPLPVTADQTAPPDQVARLDGPTYFNRLAALLVDNPPAPADAAAVATLARLGVRPGAAVDLSDPATATALNQAPSAGQAALHRVGQSLLPPQVNGWTIPRGLGTYGTDYDRRAYVAFLGLGAHLDADAVYPHAHADSDGRPLSGGHSYVLHFPAGEEPPVNGFWSLTLYNDKSLFIDNPIDRYAIGNRDELMHNPDGSLDIWVQHEDPGTARHSNWLPAPTGAFTLFLRAYWPEEALLAGAWAPPPVTRVG